MPKTGNVFILLLLIVCNSCEWEQPKNDTLESFIFSIEKSGELKYFNEMTPTGKLASVVSAIYANETLWNWALQEHKMLGFLDRDSRNLRYYNFSCTPFKFSTPATSVHKLTPGDVSVVGALGDSLTAGNGINAKTVISLLLQYRDLSFSGGGGETLGSNPTLPNILRHYNTKMVGGATGIGLPNSKVAQLNQGVAGARSDGLAEQVIALIRRMKSDSRINYKNDWKMITLFIGHNDICNYCKKGMGNLTPQNYCQRVQAALDHLQKEVPRLFVNVVSILDMSELRLLNIGITCSALHHFECICAAYPKNLTALQKMVAQYHFQLNDLVKTGRYDTSEDFTVVIQPFLEKTNIPVKTDGSVDLGYFAPDCFHFGRLMGYQSALSLWNALFEPVGKKKLRWIIGEPYHCPTPQKPYFATSKNS